MSPNYRAILEEALKDEPAILDGAGAARVLGVSARSINEWLRSGELKGSRLSGHRLGRLRIPKTAIVDFLAERAER